jgi:tetratricopeptide (TPR) repeat protein
MAAPDARLPGLTVGYLYGRAMALAATGRIDEAQAIAAKMQSISDSKQAEGGAGLNTVRDVLAVAIPVVRAKIAGARHQPEQVLAALRQAVAAEDRLAYNEPSDWFFPVRQLLGAALLQAGKSAEAEQVYRQDLKKNPDNGWSLFGLAAALRAQGHTSAANDVARQFNAAWRHADIVLASSAF